MTLLHQAAQKAVEALEREAFEAWARGPAGYVDDQLARYADGSYQDSTTLVHWSIWRAACKASRGVVAALQRQEVPREPVAEAARVLTEFACACGNVERQGWTHRPEYCWPNDESIPSTTRQQEVGSGSDAMEAHRTNGLAWAVSCWEAEVKNRPLVNVHRRTLDDTWRQVIRYFGGDPDKLLGPNHDTLHMRAQEERAWKP